MSVDVKTGTPEGTARRVKVSLHNNSLVELMSSNENGTFIDVGLSYQGLTIGDWYYINVDNGEQVNEVGTFKLCLSTATSSDFPAGAVTLAHNAGCSANLAYTTMIGTADGARPANWQMGPTSNVWFKFQATTTAVSVLIKTVNQGGTARRLVVALHDASMTVLRSAGHNLTYDNVGLSYDALTVGNWYYINVDNGDQSHERGTFTICVNDQTSYDYPAGATVIPHSANWCSANAEYTTMIGTPNGTKPPLWTNGPISNVWFKFQATTTNVAVEVKTGSAEGTIRRVKTALYDNSLNLLRTSNENGTYVDVGMSYASLTVGQWYYIAVDNGEIYYERGTFTLCVNTSTSSDYPAGAIELTNLNNWCSANAAYTTNIGTPDGIKPTNWYDGPNNNVWFKFTATTPQISINVKTGDPEGSIRRVRVALWNSSLAEIRSNGDNGNNHTDVGVGYDALTVGSVYYVSVDNASTANSYDRGTFALCINSAVNEDYPGGAIELTNLNSWCSAQGAFTTFGATPDGARPTTWTYGPTNNVYFKFKAQRPNITVNVKTQAPEGTLRYPNVAILNSSLGHVTSVKDAGANGDITINNYNGLTIGQWYYLNVDNGWQQSDRGTFMLCVDNALAGTTAFTATATQTGQVKVDWAYTNGNQSGFEIERSATPGTGYTLIQTAGVADRSFTDIDTELVRNGLTFYYRVRAINAGGGSAYSPEVAVTYLGAESGEKPVVWTKVTGATADGSRITKTAAAGWGNAGAESKNRLPDDTDGSVLHTVPTLTSGEYSFGLTAISPDNEFYSIGYAFHRTNGAMTYVRALGTMLTSFNAAAGDILKIERAGTNIHFRRNGTIVHTVSSAPTHSMIIDAALNSSASSLALSTTFGIPGSYRMTWGNKGLVIEPDTNTIRKTGATGYGSSGAFSNNTLAAGKDGWAEFTLDAFNQERSFGLSDVDTDKNYTSIDYAFYTSGTAVFVYENGVSRGNIAGAAVNDVFRVWRIDDDIYWLRNGTVVYTNSGGALQTALHADIAFATTSSNIKFARASFDSPPTEDFVTDHEEFLVLKDIFDNMGGNGWTNKTNWPTAGNWPTTATSAEMATWYGITVQNKDITGIALAGNNLTGNIRTSLQNLTRLKILQLNVNAITGPLPSELGTLTFLEDLLVSQNQMTGTLPPQISGLINLQRFHPHTNQFTGSLPTELFGLPKLRYLDISLNQFSGSLPANWATAPELREFVANESGLSGSIPSSVAVASLMTKLELSYNNLSGSIPSSIGTLVNLTFISLANNQLTGSIPTSIGSMTALVALNLNDNQLSGAIPTEIGNLIALEHINFVNNDLTGSIPASFGNLSHLQGLFLDNNQLSGSIPATITQLDEMFNLSLRNNQLTGPLPSTIGDMTALVHLYIENNQLSGAIPASIGTLANLHDLTADDNQFSGPIPPELGNLPMIQILSLNRNQLSGEIPSNLGNIGANTNFFELGLSGNQLTGGIPVSLATKDNGGLKMDFSNNDLTILPSNFTDKTGLDLNLSGNRFEFTDFEPLYTPNHGFYILSLANQKAVVATDLIQVPIGTLLNIPAVNPGQYGAVVWEYQSVGATTWTNVNSLNADPTQKTFKINSAQSSHAGSYRYKQTNTRVTGLELISEIITVEAFVNDGLVPDHIEYLALKALYESTGGAEWMQKTNWPIGDSWPTTATWEEFGTWFGVLVENKDVTELVFDFNNLVGPIPASLGNLTSLRKLSLYGNGLTGTVPVQLGNLTHLEYLALAANSLTGTLPSALSTMTSLKQLYANSNDFSGTTPAWIWDLPAIEAVTLDANEFTGEIPNNIGNATTLKQLGMNNNHLTGSIPSTIGNLVNLEYLDLQLNSLSGSLPTTIGSLASLKQIYLVNNQLTGPIPNEIGNLTALEILSLHNNHFTGSLPSTISNLVNLTTLDIQSSELTGTIPPGIGNCVSLTNLALYGNNLEGTIPVTIGNLTNLQWLGLGENELTGSIPPQIGNLTNLFSLQLNGNQLSGPIPESIGNLTNLNTLLLSHNQLSGPIPSSIGNLSHLFLAFLDDNQLSGEIPASMGNLTELHTLYLNTNKLEGAIPESIASIPTLVNLYAYSNNITSIPTTYANREQLYLYIYQNNLDFSDLEPLFSAPGVHGFMGTYALTQKPIAAPDIIDVPLNNYLIIEAADAGAHGSIVWEYQAENTSTWVEVNHLNDDQTQVRFLKVAFQPGDAGKYRYRQTNTWVVPGVTLYSEEIIVRSVDAVSATIQTTRLFNGMITATRWRTDAPYAASAEETNGVYIYKYDDKYQLEEARFAHFQPQFTSAYPPQPVNFMPAGNKFRVNNLKYDPNGNITSLRRFNEFAVRIHNFVYSYNPPPEEGEDPVQKNNKLRAIDGYASYDYNEIGELTKELSENGEDKYIDYDVSGKVIAVFSDENKTQKRVAYSYDDRGFRLSKTDYATQRITWYIRDITGNVTSIHETYIPSNVTNLTEVPVYGSSKIGTYSPQSDGGSMMAYEITDHLGNVRAIVQERSNVYTATMEETGVPEISNPRVTENYFFENIFETEVADWRMNHTAPIPGIVPTPERAAYLFWNDTPGTQAEDKAIGPAITLKVEAGDKIALEAFARYQSQTTYTRDMTLPLLSTLLGNSFIGLHGVDNLGAITGMFQDAIGAWGFLNPGTDDTKPYAYLNFILFDKNFQYRYAGAQRVGDDGEFEAGQEAIGITFDHVKFDSLTIYEEGYIYAWVSNETKGARVWFDDFKITQKHAYLSQSTDYDPWGMVQRDVKTDEEMIYRYGYQGQFAEKDEETGWNHFDAREYDAVAAKWLSPDPVKEEWSPYMSMGNDPVSRFDRDGRCTECPNPDWGLWKDVTNGYQWINGNTVYEMLDISKGVEGWVRISFNGDNGMLQEVVVREPFWERTAKKGEAFVAHIFDPFVDVTTTAGSAFANGYSEAYYRYVKEESTMYAPHFNSYRLEHGFHLKSIHFTDNSHERQTQLMTNTLGVFMTVSGFGVNVPVSKNGILNFGANFVIKTATKTTVLKSAEASLEFTEY